MVLNKVMLIGHLGNDPEIHHTQAGKPVANMSVATSERWTDKQSGEKRERTEWHRVVVFSEGLANIVSRFLVKGSKVYLEGQLQTRKWTDKQGIDRYTTEVVLLGFGDKIVMLDGASGAGRPPPATDANAYGQEKQAGYQAGYQGGLSGKPDLCAGPGLFQPLAGPRRYAGERVRACHGPGTG